MRSLLVTSTFFLWLGRTLAIQAKQWDLKHDDDLTSFVTRPEIKAPLFDVSVNVPEKVSPGYWFVAPYWLIEPEPYTQKYQPCQVGPHIYDSEGTLVWAGSCDFGNVNAFDFKVVNSIDNQPHLSFIIGRGDDNKIDNQGTAHVMSTSYEIEKSMTVEDDRGGFDIHEFNILDNGHTALVTAYRPMYVNMSTAGFAGAGWVQTGGFEEIDIVTGETLFDWRTGDHIPLNESSFIKPEGPPGSPPGWDYIHVNSVDKDVDGNYLLSARFSNTIYLISGQTGEVLWRLGGSISSFQLEDFRIYRQHHARFVEQNSTHVTISFLNNAADEISQDEHTSDALVVRLDLTTMVARTVLRYDRPDGGLTRLRGNVQRLSTGNYFVGWSEAGYHSEFTPEGECVMEARFRSDRFSTYRAYKYEFSGIPAAPPDMKVSVYETQSSQKSTVMYVSWNGATDIASWNFYAQAAQKSEPVLIGSAPKTGFESMFTSDGFMDWVSVEPVHVNGTALARSPVYRSLLPSEWSAGVNPILERPTPDDPAVVLAMAAQEAANHPPNTEEEIKEEPAEIPNPNMDMDMGMDESLGLGDHEDHDSSDDVDPETAAKASGMAYEVLGGMGAFLIFSLVFCSAGGVFLALLFAYRRRKRALYEWIPSDEDLAGNPTEEPSQRRSSNRPEMQSTTQ